MVSATDLAERTLHAMEALRNLFSALFLASIGMLMNPRFLWQHFDILLASLVTIVLAKATLTFLVVRAFGYSNRTALSVGVAMAQARAPPPRGIRTLERPTIDAVSPLMQSPPRIPRPGNRDSPVLELRASE